MADACSPPKTLMEKIPLGGFLRGMQGKPSWGRFCSAAALVVAVAQEFRDKPVAHVALWLATATGVYGVNKWLTPAEGSQP